MMTGYQTITKKDFERVMGVLYEKAISVSLTGGIDTMMAIEQLCCYKTKKVENCKHLDIFTLSDLQDEFNEIKISFNSITNITQYITKDKEDIDILIEMRESKVRINKA